MNSNSFKCFKHPVKTVEAVCAEPVCNHYRFFCVTCFLENSAHFINHKNQIYDVQEFLQSHQNNFIRTTGIQEIDTQLQIIQQHMKDYELLIKQKRQGYQQVFQEIEKKFEETKHQCSKEVEEYLQILVQKQLAHYNYLKDKVDRYKQNLNINDWVGIKKQSEQEVSFYFENIIKNQYNTHKEFKQEIKLYSSSFQRNIMELDNSHSSKVIDMCIEDMKSVFKEKFNELKEILVVPNDEQLNTIKNSKIQGFMNYQNSKLFKQKDLNHSEIATNNHNNMPDFAEESQVLIQNSRNGNGNGIRQASHILPNHQVNSHMNFFANSNNSCINSNLMESKKEHLYKSNIYGTTKYGGLNFTNTAQSYPNEDHNIINHNLNNEGEIEMESDQEESQYQKKNGTMNYGSYSNNQQQFSSKKGISGLKLLQNVKETEIFQKPQPKVPTSFTHTEGITSILLYDTLRGKNIIVTGSLDKSLRLWNLDKDNFDHIKTLEGHNSPITCLQKIEKDGVGFIASGDSTHEIKIWNPTLSGNELITTLNGHFQGIHDILYLGGYLISSSKDMTIKVWSLEELKCVQTIEMDMSAKSITECGELLIATTYDGFKIFNFINDREGGQIFKLKSYNNKAHRSGISKIQGIQSSEIELITSGKDGLIKLWNISKGVCVKQLKGHEDCVYDLLYYKDRLFSSGRDGLKIWDMENCVLERSGSHKYISDEMLGQIQVLEQYNCVLSVGNGDCFIKIIPL